MKSGTWIVAPVSSLAGFGPSGNRISSKSWVGRDYLQLNVDRQLDADQAVLVAQQVGNAPFFQEREHRLQELFIDWHLVIGLRVHEVVVRTVRVQVRRLVLVDSDRL